VEQAVSGLRFRNTVLVFLEVEGTGWFPDQWLYIHSAELQTGRLTNFRNWIPEICQGSPNTILALEYWCYDDDALWGEDENTLVTRATEEIHKTGLIPGGKVLQGKVVRLPRCYPVYARGYREKLQVVQEFLQGFSGLSAVGRYGAFKYNNQDHSILMGLMVADNLTKGTSHDLWAVNTDYEVYQEAAIITESGLAPA
jgi:protoporphyrinogen oxidase